MELSVRARDVAVLEGEELDLPKARVVDPEREGLGPVPAVGQGDVERGPRRAVDLDGLVSWMHKDYIHRVCVCRLSMVARTISLSEDAYQALAASKRPGESFSDVVRRLARRRSLTDLVGVVDRKAADAILHAIEANRRDRLARRR